MGRVTRLVISNAQKDWICRRAWKHWVSTGKAKPWMYHKLRKDLDKPMFQPALRAMVAKAIRAKRRFDKTRPLVG